HHLRLPPYLTSGESPKLQSGSQQIVLADQVSFEVLGARVSIEPVHLDSLVEIGPSEIDEIPPAARRHDLILGHGSRDAGSLHLDEQLSFGWAPGRSVVLDVSDSSPIPPGSGDSSPSLPLCGVPQAGKRGQFAS